MTNGAQEGDADEFTAMARDMIKCGSGCSADGDVMNMYEGAFMGANLHNIRGLADDESQESDGSEDGPAAGLQVDEGEPEARAGAGGGGAAGSGNTGKHANKEGGGRGAAPKKPTDSDLGHIADECSKAQRLWRKGLATLSDNMIELRSSAEESLREAFPNKDNQHLRNAYVLCELRTAFASACLAESSADLETLIDAFKRSCDIPVHFLFSGPAPGASPEAAGKGQEAGSPGAKAKGAAELMSYDDFLKQHLPPGTTEIEESLKTEVEAKWKKMDDAGVQRDHAGADGALRLMVVLDSLPARDGRAPAEGDADKSQASASNSAPPDDGDAFSTPTKQQRSAGQGNTPNTLTPTILRRAPPCKGYEDLRTITDLNEMALEYEAQTTFDDIKTLTGQLLSFRTCLRGLQVSWKTSVAELGLALKGWKVANEQSEKDAAKAKAKTAKESGGKRKKGNAVMDMFMENGEAVASFDARVEGWPSKEDAAPIFVNTTNIDMKPYMVSGCDLAFVDSNLCDVGKSLTEFVTDFAKSPWRMSAERAMRTSLDTNRKDTSANDFVLTTLAKYCPAGSVLCPHLDVNNRLRPETSLCNFGLKQGSSHASMERQCLWTARLCTSGRRTVVILDLDEVKEHMMKQGIVGKEVKLYVKEMGVSTALEYVNSGKKVFACTAAKGDLLWVPANVVLLEHVGDESDCFGLRFSMLLGRDASRYDSFVKVAASKMTPSTHVSKAVVAAVTTLTAAWSSQEGS